ncbi:replication/maintenance protein RepL [Pectinatus frisingensis]
MSLMTVSQTLRTLIDSNFLQKINSGAYRVNPNVLFEGCKADQLNVLVKYTDTAKEVAQDNKQQQKAI